MFKNRIMLTNVLNLVKFDPGKNVNPLDELRNFFCNPERYQLREVFRRAQYVI